MSGLRWLGAAAVAVTLAGSAWWSLRGQSAAAPPLEPAAAQAGSESNAGSASAIEHAPPVAPARPAAVLTAAARAELKASQAELTPISLDLCGVGAVPVRVPLQASNRDLAQRPHHLSDHAMAEAWPRVLAALEAGPTDRGRAAALVLRAAGLPEPADTLPYVRQLAELGRSTRDAGALQWALAVCEGAPKLPQCQAIHPSDLVTLQPEDGRHWLQLGSVDMARRGEALLKASQARLIGTEPSLAAAVEAAAPPDLLPYLRQKLLIDATGVEAALVDRAGGFVLFNACAKAGADNTAACSALADTLYQHGQDLRSLGWAWQVGQRMGWSAERVKAVRAEEKLLAGQLPQIETLQMFSCASVDQMRNWTFERAQLGERVALQRRAAAASPASGSLPR